jgi:hypothetical protein
MLAELVFKCKNHTSGCQQEVDYSKVYEHETECDFTPFKCSGFPDGCNVTLLKRELA